MKPWLSRKRATAVYSVLGMDGRIELAVSKSFRTTAVCGNNNNDDDNDNVNKNKKKAAVRARLHEACNTTGDRWVGARGGEDRVEVTGWAAYSGAQDTTEQDARHTSHGNLLLLAASMLGDNSVMSKNAKPRDALQDLPHKT